MTISVVIPTFKAAAFIEATLKSVFAQTIPPEELIVVDDCSPDDTVGVVTRCFVEAPFPCRLIRLESNSGGPAKPMNAGIAAAIGEWIVTLDHDDELMPSRIVDLKNAHNNDCELVIGRMHVGDPSDDRGHLLDKAWTSVESMTTARSESLTILDANTAYTGLAEFGCYAMSCSAMAFSKKLWTEIGGFDETVKACIDFAFLEAALRTHPLGVLDAPVALWRHRPSNLSHDYRLRVNDVSTVMQRIHDRCQVLPPRLTPHLRNELLNRAYLLACRHEHRAAWRAWWQSVRQYGLRFRSLIVALKMMARRFL